MKRFLLASISVAVLCAATGCSPTNGSVGHVVARSDAPGWAPHQPVRQMADLQKWYLENGTSEVPHPTSVEVKRQRWSTFLATAQADIGGRPLSDAPAGDAFMYVLIMHGRAALSDQGPDLPKLDYQWVATTVNESSGLSGMTFAVAGAAEPSWFPSMASLPDPS